MSEHPLFWWLVRDHIERDWARARKHVTDGLISLVEHDEELVLGETENPYYGGALLLANGRTLAETLKRDKVVLDPRIKPPVSVSDFTQLAAYFDHENGRRKDGAYIFDTEANRVYRVNNLNNSPKDTVIPVHELIPADFKAINGSHPEVGTKGYLLVALPQIYRHVTSFQISRSAHTPLGMGKVVQADKDGLNQEFVLRYDPASNGPFIDEEKGVVGIHRVYSPGFRRDIGSWSERKLTMDYIVQRTETTGSLAQSL